MTAPTRIDRPALKAVAVQGCRVADDGVRWCEITIDAVLKNDAELKAHITRLEAFFR